MVASCFARGAVTLPEYFAKHGYHVAGAGKVYHHTPGFNPPEQWDEYFAQVFDDPWHRPGPGDAFPVRGIHWPKGFPLCDLENVRVGQRPPLNPKEFDWGPVNKDDEEMGDGQAVKWATEFLGREHDEPFFLAVGVFRPHLPWYAPQEYFDLYPLDRIVLPEVPADDLSDVPAAGRKIAKYRGDEWAYLKQQRRWIDAVQAYLASISFADAMVGRGHRLRSMRAGTATTRSSFCGLITAGIWARNITGTNSRYGKRRRAFLSSSSPPA